MNISAANPVNNIADSAILHSIADAFAKIEAQDILVKRVTLERERYEELITKKGSLNYLCQNNHDLEITEEQALVGALWGAQLEIGSESKVYGEQGFMPSALYSEDNMHNVDFCTEAVIDFTTPKLTMPEVLFRKKLRSLKDNMTIIVKTRARPIYGNVPKNEVTALDTLREMITEAEFRKYMVHGFILVKGESGRIYQIHRCASHTYVWENGQVVEEICVRIQDRRIPPTDNVIAFKVLIETDEEEFKKLGNVYNMRNQERLAA